MEEAWEALQGAIEAMEETAGRGRRRWRRRCRLRRSTTVEQLRAEQEAVETAAAVAAVATRMRLEEELACHTQRLEEARAQLYTSGVPPPPAAAADAELCVMCFDAPKDHIILPCFHVCVCEACATLLTQMDKPSCPICRTAIQQTNKVFHS